MSVEPVCVLNRAGLEENSFSQIQAVVALHRTMERAMQWFFGQTPRLAPEDLIAQDEFSYDLIVPFRDGLILSYDTN